MPSIIEIASASVVRSLTNSLTKAVQNGLPDFLQEHCEQGEDEALSLTKLFMQEYMIPGKASKAQKPDETKSGAKKASKKGSKESGPTELIRQRNKEGLVIVKGTMLVLTGSDSTTVYRKLNAKGNMVKRTSKEDQALCERLGLTIDPEAEKEIEPLTEENMERWFATKGGLTNAQLKEKAKELEIELSKQNLTKKELKEIFEAALNKSEDEQEEEDEQDSEIKLTNENVELWFGPRKDGGLTVPQLKEKAKALNIELKGSKKDDIKTAFENALEIPEEPEAEIVDSEQEEEEEDPEQDAYDAETIKISDETQEAEILESEEEEEEDEE